MHHVSKAIIPVLLLSIVASCKLGWMDISFLHIRGYELKMTILNYGWHYRDDDPFTSGETVQSKNYEDAVFTINPDYAQLLEDDMDEIVMRTDSLSKIDAGELYLETKKYHIKICLDHKKIVRRDTSFFKQLVYMDILGQFELYDKDGGDLLYSNTQSRYWIRNELICTGWASKKFLNNKIEELWLSQMAPRVRAFVQKFENPEYDRYSRYSATRYSKPERTEASGARAEMTEL